jgi:hypothetical protein
VPVGKGNGQNAYNESQPAVVPDEANVDDLSAERHNVSLSFMQDPPDEVLVGGEMTLTLCVKCPSGCELVGHTLAIKGPERFLIDGLELVEFDGTLNKTAPFTIQVPAKVGEHTWTAVFPELAEEDIIHEETGLDFSFTVKPHPTSMAVWNVKSPFVVGSDFEIIVGAKCGLGCSLANQEVEVYDEKDNLVATGRLSNEIYSSSLDLYWTTVKLKAPEQLGSFTWTAKLPTPDDCHHECSYTFSFSTSELPDCEVTVRVLEKETGDPIGNAQVTLRPKLYTGFTNEQGEVRLHVPRGEYKVSINAARQAPRGIEYKWGEVPRVTRGYEYIVYVPPENAESLTPFERTYQIDEDTTIEVELVGIIEPPEEDTL